MQTDKKGIAKRDAPIKQLVNLVFYNEAILYNGAYYLEKMAENRQSSSL